MIKKIAVKNYQSLYDVEVELGKFTVLYGNSDVGKSAFYRAIRGLLIGETGDDFISLEKTRVGVSIQVAPDKEIVWLKSKGKSSSYILFSGGVKVREWRRARQLPQELELLLQIRSVNIDGDKFYPNLRGQFDPMFLMFESPGKKARVLGSLVSNILLQGIRKANVERNRTEADIRATSELAEDLQKKMEIDWNPLLDKVNALSSYADVLVKRGDSYNSLSSTVHRFSLCEDRDDKLSALSEQGKYSLENLEKAIRFAKKYEELFPLVEKYKRLKKLQVFKPKPVPKTVKCQELQDMVLWLKPAHAKMKIFARDIFLSTKESKRLEGEIKVVSLSIKEAIAASLITCPHCGKEFERG